MQTKRGRASMLLILRLALILALTSCKTCPENVSENVVVPPLPEFPSPIVNGASVVSLDVVTESVTMPFWYWKAITEYVIDTEAAIERLSIDLGGF